MDRCSCIACLSFWNAHFYDVFVCHSYLHVYRRECSWCVPWSIKVLNPAVTLFICIYCRFKEFIPSFAFVWQVLSCCLLGGCSTCLIHYVHLCCCLIFSSCVCTLGKQNDLFSFWWIYKFQTLIWGKWFPATMQSQKHTLNARSHPSLDHFVE